MLDFDGDLTGQVVRAHFLQRIRPEMRFESPQTLAAQIARDVEAAREILATSPTGEA